MSMSDAVVNCASLVGPSEEPYVHHPEEAARYSAMLLFYALTVVHAVAVIAYVSFASVHSRRRSLAAQCPIYTLSVEEEDC